MFTGVQGSINMPAVFGDNMVLQRQSEVTVWGAHTCDWRLAVPEIRVTGSWAPLDTAVAEYTMDGHWKAKIRTGAAGGPYTLKIFSSLNETVEYKNVMLGEVWLCSGQSNMHWWMSSVNATGKYNDEIAGATKQSDIRIFSLPLIGAEYPQNDCDASWEECSPKTLENTSAVAYFFARHLKEALGVPVGIIVSAWGGTCFDVWTPKELIYGNPSLKASFDSSHPDGPPWPADAGGLYNAMIHPLVPFHIAGAIWYQGESNVGRYQTYAEGMKTMITGWRKSFGREFPFYQVQIAPFRYNTPHNEAALLREQQELATVITPKTGMVVVSDLVENVGDIHPTDKLNVGKRLANLALGDTYRQPLAEYRNPTFGRLTVEKGKAVVSFNHTGTGLICRGKKVEGLKIAGADGVYYDADGTLKNDRLTVSSPHVKEPVSVTYCFDDVSFGNLFTKDGLPVAPFRSDRTGFPEAYELSAQERKEGFKMLFDGTNMDCWTGNTTDYRIVDGCIDVDASGTAVGNLYTKDEYADFIFRFEFQLTPAANNGVGIRAPMEGDNAYNAMEIQILDCENPEYDRIAPYQHHGSVYGVIPAGHGGMKPVGEWNEEEIYAGGDHIRVTLNEAVILDGNIREASKNGTPDGNGHPGLLNKSGHIGFLGHGSPLKFRNIRIKTLK
jgi:sialate O-acetylesterase